MSSCDVFTYLFALDLQNEIQLPINIFLLFLAGFVYWVVVVNAPPNKKKLEIIVFKNKLLLVSLLHLAGLCEKS